MPKRTDIKNILILGSGPIVIGQACEFDYSGTQACKALKEEGYKVILVNSNPATIMTDPEIAHSTYIEPIHWKIIKKIIEKEKPHAILPTMGGQIALNCSLDLKKRGILDDFNIEMIGANAEVIEKSENRAYFDAMIKKIGLETAPSFISRTISESMKIVKKIGFPCIVRSSFAMGGIGNGIAYNIKEFKNICEEKINMSPDGKILISESLIGWKEYEMEVMRDKKDNCIVICAIENIDPMGIHTGDSITVVPAQTLTDKEYQIMRNAAISILREIGIETGGSNIQFSINPKTGKLVVIEMNPRVSRSSALASKATGFPIAKVSAKLAVGYTLDELTNEITNNKIPISFEPTIDYIVTKIPKFNFDKLHGIDDRLGTTMKSVGEVMAIGRTQQESIQKALNSLEKNINGFNSRIKYNDKNDLCILKYELSNAGSERILYVADAFRVGMSVDEVFGLTKIDPWFLSQIEDLIKTEKEIINLGKSILNKEYFLYLKKKGFSDVYLANLIGITEEDVRKFRKDYDIHPVYKRIDTCSAEFQTSTSYMYSTYDEECESNPNRNNRKILILGSGPNRIGQGIEFDYCCVQTAISLRKEGYEVVMVNCNPETVSTDYDISNRLYFEPITLESVLEIIRIENPIGIILQCGGQTAINLAQPLNNHNIQIIGTDANSIYLSENRECFQKIVKKLGFKQPKHTSVCAIELAKSQANIIGYPMIVRPSYVLGGLSMKIIYDESNLVKYFNTINIDQFPIVLDKFLEHAIEVEIDAIFDGKNILICGILEHIEEAGIHSGDSSFYFPTYTIRDDIKESMCFQVEKLAVELKVIGFINVQFAIQNNVIYIIEVNLRASRTIPFLSKATGLSLSKIATKVMIGKSLTEQKIKCRYLNKYFFIKKSVFPFSNFLDIDPTLGPEMRSTGEVMGIGKTISEAIAKANFSYYQSCIEEKGRALLVIEDECEKKTINLILKLIRYGYKLDVTVHTKKILHKFGIKKNIFNKIYVNYDKNIKMNLKNKKYNYIINICTNNKHHMHDQYQFIRQSALQNRIYFDTTLRGSLLTVMSLKTKISDFHVISLQEMYKN